MSARHVLYVAWGFPPCRGGGVYRALATVNALAHAGHRVTVLTANRETFLNYTGADSALEELIDPRVSVVRVPFDWPRQETDLRAYSVWRVAAPRVWSRVRSRLDVRHFPEVGYGPWRPRLEEAARRIHASDPVDLVIATANPNVDFMAAHALFEEHGTPYILDYRDAWLLDVFTGEQVHPDASRAAKWEAELVSHAHEIWFVNEPIRAWHASRYPQAESRMHVVSNGFDPGVAPKPTAVGGGRTGPLRFGYIGTLTSKVPLQEFLEGWALARRDTPEMHDAIADLWGYLGYYAAPDAKLAGLVESYRGESVNYRGPLAKTAVGSVYEALDVLLLILGKGRYVTSGKVYEYAASALPIVSIHDPGNAASEVLRGYPLWFPVEDVSPSGIAQAMSAAARVARNTPAEVREECIRYSSQFARSAQLSPRIGGLSPIASPAEHGGTL